MADVEELFDAFDFYRMHTNYYQQLPYARTLKRTPERVDKLRAMDAWCTEKGFDPHFWLYSLFMSRKWFFAPQWNQLCSEKHIPKYHNIKSGELYVQAMRARDERRRKQTDFHPWRDVGTSSERIKAQYARAGLEVACKDDWTRTYGYHPKSEICQACTAQTACRERLTRAFRFDIVALRDGRMDLQQALIIHANT